MRRDRLRCDVDAFLLRLVEHRGNETHLELEREDLDAHCTAPRSQHRVRTRFSVYAGWWADRIMSSVPREILRVIKARAERTDRAPKAMIRAATAARPRASAPTCARRTRSTRPADRARPDAAVHDPARAGRVSRGRWVFFTFHRTVPKAAENPYGTAWIVSQSAVPGSINDVRQSRAPRFRMSLGRRAAQVRPVRLRYSGKPRSPSRNGRRRYRRSKEALPVVPWWPACPPG